jgi:hypothetical protein
MWPLLKKTGRIAVTVVLGFFVFYLFSTLAVIPLASPWLIRSQAAKLLDHPVSVRSVWFNPFLMRVSVKGFAIMDADKKVMVGFDRFWVDASFLSLFKKVYRVESTGIDGLVVHAALLPGNRVNLLELVPTEAGSKKAAQPAMPAAQPVPEKAEVKAASSAPQALPLIIVDSIALKHGTITVTDKTLTPSFVTTLSDIDISVTNVSTNPSAQTRAVIKARLDEKGTIAVEALMKPLMTPMELESTFSLNDYALQVLTPYVGKYTGRSVKDGKLDLKMDYRISNNKINARHKLLIQRFGFGRKVESKDALPLPFGLAVALLEDPQGRIAVSLPVTGDMSKPDFRYMPLLWQVVRNFFIKLVTSPLMSLVSMMGGDAGTDELGYISFEPGKPELGEAANKKLDALIQLLKERPKLLVEINGSYDPEVDWKTIKIDAFDNEYKAWSKESSGNDLRVHQELYEKHFGIRAYWAIEREFKAKGTPEEEQKSEIRRRIIESGKPDVPALEALAMARAIPVYDLIIASGFDTNRVKIGPVKATQSSMGMIPLEFTLTVFGETDPASPQPAEGSAAPVGAGTK